MVTYINIYIYNYVHVSRLSCLATVCKARNDSRSYLIYIHTRTYTHTYTFLSFLLKKIVYSIWETVIKRNVPGAINLIMQLKVPHIETMWSTDRSRQLATRVAQQVMTQKRGERLEMVVIFNRWIMLILWNKIKIMKFYKIINQIKTMKKGWKICIEFFFPIFNKFYSIFVLIFNLTLIFY